MSKALKVLDGVALMLTGGGLLGGALAAIDIVPASAGVICAVAVGAGVFACVIVRQLLPAAPETSHEGDAFDGSMHFVEGADFIRMKTPIRDSLDPTVPGTVNWHAQNDSVAKTF